MANCGFYYVLPSPRLRKSEITMKWLCTVGVAVSLALQPALADELFGNHP
jgi:beta-glucosidase